jgi:hypothetical protein
MFFLLNEHKYSNIHADKGCTFGEAQACVLLSLDYRPTLPLISDQIEPDFRTAVR